VLVFVSHSAPVKCAKTSSTDPKPGRPWAPSPGPPCRPPLCLGGDPPGSSPGSDDSYKVRLTAHSAAHINEFCVFAVLALETGSPRLTPVISLPVCPLEDLGRMEREAKRGDRKGKKGNRNEDSCKFTPADELLAGEECLSLPRSACHCLRSPLHAMPQALRWRRWPPPHTSIAHHCWSRPPPGSGPGTATAPETRSARCQHPCAGLLQLPLPPPPGRLSRLACSVPGKHPA
jgi:hypothetical protein